MTQNRLVSNGSGDAELAIGLGVAVFDDAPKQLGRQYPHACSASQPRVLTPASATYRRSWLRKKYSGEGGIQKGNTAPKVRREGFPREDAHAGTRPCRTQGTHIMTARVRG